MEDTSMQSGTPGSLKICTVMPFVPVQQRQEARSQAVCVILQLGAFPATGSRLEAGPKDWPTETTVLQTTGTHPRQPVTCTPGTQCDCATALQY